MSYILDALQKSSAETDGNPQPNQTQAKTTGLALPWKIAIGAVLATNVLLLFLWQSEGRDTILRNGSAAPSSQAERSESAANDNANAATQAGSQQAVPEAQSKRTLPGIASPKPPQAVAAASPPGSSTGQTRTPTTPRTFKPTGAPITIAEAATVDSSPAFSLDQPSDLSPRANEDSVQPQIPVASPAERTNSPTGVSSLSDLSENARQSLYVLTFSFHIYADDADLRAVVVNGERLTEGSKITAGNNQEFRLLEILENGVILQFDHQGVTETVQIPVIEDWKDA